MGASGGEEESHWSLVVSGELKLVRVFRVMHPSSACPIPTAALKGPTNGSVAPLWLTEFLYIDRSFDTYLPDLPLQFTEPKLNT